MSEALFPSGPVENRAVATAPPAAAEEDDRAELVLPRDPKSIFLGGLFFLAAFTALYVARDVVLPIMVAFVLKLLLQPAIRSLQKIYVPRAMSAVLVIAVVIVAFFGFFAMLSAPASNWAGKLADGIPRLEEHLSILTRPLDTMRQVLHQAEKVAEEPTDGATPVKVKSAGIASALFSATWTALAGILTTLLLLFFLLVTGDLFLRRLVEALPTFQKKRQAVDIAQKLEEDISIYLVTITLLNAAVGVATGLTMYFIGLADPFLWGALAFLLNYVLILGPCAGIVIFALAGLLTFDSLSMAMLPPLLYLLIHILEGELITPLLLARRFTLNPVLVIVSLIFWFWMWGVMGAIVAVPILAVTKIICDRIEPLRGFGHFLEG
jgi:predicted PurR-regulated permease PerM